MTDRNAHVEQVEVGESSLVTSRPNFVVSGRLSRDQVEIDVIAGPRGDDAVVHREKFVPGVVTEDSPIEGFQSPEEPGLVLSMTEPFFVYAEFGFELTDADCAALQLDGPEDAVVRCLLTLSGSLSEIPANLLVPIVINSAKRLARQLVLQDGNLSTRFPTLQT